MRLASNKAQGRLHTYHTPSKIRHFQLSVRAEKQVFWFDVAMNHVFLVLFIIVRIRYYYYILYEIDQRFGHLTNVLSIVYG